MAKSVLILNEAEVRQALDMASCIEACERAFVSYSSGGAEQPDVIHLDVPESRGEIHVKAGHLHGQPYYAVKVASGFTGSGSSVADGFVTVFDSRNGAPVAFLLDNGFVTDLRTGAAGAVAARHLAPTRIGTVAVIGTGIQAGKQLEGLVEVRTDLSAVRVWGRSSERAAIRAETLREGLGGRCEVEAVREIEATVTGADVVITCTAAREPLVRRSWLKPGAHVLALGSDGAGKQELDPLILHDADLLVVDSRDQCLRLGELQWAPQEAERAVELGAICAGEAPGRTGGDQLTVCDLTGLGAQDVAAANVVMGQVAGLGRVLEL
jgi:ornithine cyclodeaminase